MGSIVSSRWAASSSRHPRTRSSASGARDEPGDVQDAGVAELGQVAHRRAGAAVLVDRDDERAAPTRGGRGDDRDAEVEAADDLEHADVDDDQHDRVDALPQQPLDHAAHAVRVGVERAHRLDVVARGARGEVEVHRDRGRTVVRDARRDEPDRAGAAGDERARGGRGAVAQLRDRLLDACARGGAHVRQVVQHARDRLVRDAGEPGDVEDVRRARADLSSVTRAPVRARRSSGRRLRCTRPAARPAP